MLAKQFFTLISCLFFTGPVFSMSTEATQAKMTPQEMLFEGILNPDKEKAFEMTLQAIQNGADPDIKNNYGNTALISAVTTDNQKIVKLLLEDARVNPDIKNNYGNTALISAVTTGNQKIVKSLLDARANPDIQNNQGYTALAGAAHLENKEIVELLLNANANPNLQDYMGYTALFLATFKGNKEIMELLLNANADPNIQDKNGYTAFIWSIKLNKNEDIQKLLLKGATIFKVNDAVIQQLLMLNISEKDRQQIAQFFNEEVSEQPKARRCRCNIL